MKSTGDLFRCYAGIMARVGPSRPLNVGGNGSALRHGLGGVSRRHAVSNGDLTRVGFYAMVARMVARRDRDVEVTSFGASVEVSKHAKGRGRRPVEGLVASVRIDFRGTNADFAYGTGASVYSIGAALS